jgi:hypothetical protein
MTAYAMTSTIGSDRQAILNLTTGERFEFPPEDGPLLASMLDGQYPECEHCEDREDVCPACGVCVECRSDDNDCTECAEDGDEDPGDDAAS